MPSTPPIDFRSDTVTKPTPAMRRAMAEAVVGDDVLGDDPTVIALQERVASMMGQEAGCFVPTGTMANQTAIRAHTEPGDEIICHADSHIINYETGAPAALSGVMVRCVDATGPGGDRGMFDAEQIRACVRPDAIHFPHSKLVVVENTQNRGGGAVWPIEQVQRVVRASRELGLSLHLDGARIWNACAATGLKPVDYARHFDTISCCFSKGLGAPAGSMVVGPKPLIARVQRFRKMFGGAMRQSGVLAAAAIHALDHHMARLAEDHANAQRLAKGLAPIPGFRLAFPVETNMVFIDIDPSLGTAASICSALKARGVLALPTAPQQFRAVCHLDVDAHAIERAIQIVGESIANGARTLAGVG
jgi:threonine aldolase